MLSPGYVEGIHPMVSPFTQRYGFMTEWFAGTAPGSGTYETADLGIYFPVSVPTTCVARRMWWANGSSVTGNVEAGIYLDGGHKPGAKLITTGSVGQATTSVVQFADITDTTLSPGLYWLYLSCSSTSSTFFRSVLNAVSTGIFAELVRFQQASIGPGSAPSSATPVEGAGQNVYLFGFSTTTIT